MEYQGMRIKLGRSTLQSVLRRENMFTNFNIKLEDIFKKKKKLRLFDIDPDLQKGENMDIQKITQILDHVMMFKKVGKHVCKCTYQNLWWRFCNCWQDIDTFSREVSLFGGSCTFSNTPTRIHHSLSILL